MSAHTPEHYGKAASFYDGSPTGQYDDEAAHALRCHFELLEAARKACQALLYADHPLDRTIGAELEAVIAKATGGAA
jgi:hypothetical protein